MLHFSILQIACLAIKDEGRWGYVIGFWKVTCISFVPYLKSATKPLNVLVVCTCPLITELAVKLRLKYPLLSTTSPDPTM